MKFKYVFFILSCFLIFSFSCYSSEKEKAWNKMCEEVNQWTDGLGLPIDTNIKEAVISFNLLGHQTRQSCEGHLDWGYAAPWIDFETKPEVKTLIHLFSLVCEDLTKEEELLKNKYPGLPFEKILEEPESLLWQILQEKVHQLSKEYNLALKNQTQQLHALLNDFYHSRQVPYDRILIILTSTSPRIQSIGADWQDCRSEKERKVKLQEYQDEMQCLTDFLKNRFFES